MPRCRSSTVEESRAVSPENEAYGTVEEIHVTATRAMACHAVQCSAVQCSYQCRMHLPLNAACTFLFTANVPPAANVVLAFRTLGAALAVVAVAADGALEAVPELFIL